ncbi:MAG: hypothetical protein ACREFM_00050 [Hypericibacter sp.]
MANPVWPVTLPPFVLTEGHQETWGNNLLRTQMDAGEAKARRRFTKDVRPIQVTVEMTTAQVAIFDDFFHNTLKDGAIRFDWVLPRTQAAATFRIIPPFPVPPTPGAKFWRPTFTLEQVG